MPTTPLRRPIGQSVLFVDTQDPSPLDDRPTIGARAGYFWLNQTDNSWWVCRDASPSAAVWDCLTTAYIFNKQVFGNYSVDAIDHGRLIFCTTGTPTFTLPLASTLLIGWCVALKVRGTTGTIARSGSDTIDGGTSFSLSSGQSVWVVRTGSSSFEVMT